MSSSAIIGRSPAICLAIVLLPLPGNPLIRTTSNGPPLVSRLSAVARVENLFDTEIVTRNQGGSMDLGVPLTVWLGVRYGF